MGSNLKRFLKIRDGFLILALLGVHVPDILVPDVEIRFEDRDLLKCLQSLGIVALLVVAPPERVVIRPVVWVELYSLLVRLEGLRVVATIRVHIP